MKSTTRLIVFVITLFCFNSTAQDEKKDHGNVNLHFGTLMVYSTFSIGYESFDFLSNSESHSIHGNIRVGGWNASISNKNSGVQSSLGISYLYGKKNHKLEFNSEFVAHFDKGLKGQAITYIASLYRPFLGYRYQPLDKKIILRFGIGWKEVVQFGVGFRL